MSPEDRRKKLDALRARQKATRERLSARRQAKKKDKEEKKPSRWWLLLLLLVLLALLCCLGDCSEDEVEPEPAPVPAQPVPTEPEQPPVQEPGDRIDRQDRPEFQTAPPKPLTWIQSFQMQVAARSPRLAECFEGARRPGTLKWTTSVEPGEGHVSEHMIEPMLMSDDLTRKQRLCVLEVLEDPTYDLDVGDERSTPSRVSLVIEF